MTLRSRPASESKSPSFELDGTLAHAFLMPDQEPAALDLHEFDQQRSE